MFLNISQNSQENTFTCNFIKKETLAQMFSCEFCEIFKNTYFCRTPLVAASRNSRNVSLSNFLISVLKHFENNYIPEEIFERYTKQLITKIFVFIPKIFFYKKRKHTFIVDLKFNISCRFYLGNFDLLLHVIGCTRKLCNGPQINCTKGNYKLQ